MKALVIKPFTMGSGKYKEGQVIDLDDACINRLSGQGLVAIESVKVAVEEKIDVATPVEKSAEKSKRKKKK